MMSTGIYEFMKTFVVACAFGSIIGICLSVIGEKIGKLVVWIMGRREKAKAKKKETEQ